MEKRNARLEALKMIISSEEIRTQATLRERLSALGYQCTQSTLSRDLRQARIVKGMGECGDYVYMLPAEGAVRRVSEIHATLASVQAKGILDVRFTGALAVVRTLAGHASHVALDIDDLHSPLILGTIAGDDTVFVALAEDADRSEVLNAIAK